MCGTFVALPSVTKNNDMVFGKNSDRDANEAQALVHVPAAYHGKGEVVSCTYINILQVENTFAIFLS